ALQANDGSTVQLDEGASMNRQSGLNRRDFVKTASVVSATLLAGRGFTSAAETAPVGSPGSTPAPFRKAVKYGMVKHDGPMVEKFKLLKELGFDGVEMDSPNS